MKFIVKFSALSVLFVGAMAHAQDEAKTWLEESIAHVTGLDSFQADYTLTMTDKGSGAKEELKGKILLRGSNDMFFELGQETPQLQLFSKEGETVLYVPDMDRYMPTPAARAEMLKNMGSQGSNTVFKWLAGYLSNDPVLLSEITASEFIGQVELDTRPVNHARYTYEGYTVEAWIPQDAAPTILQLQFAFPQGPNLPDITFRFTNPKTNETIEDKVIVFAASDKMEKVDSPQDLFKPKENIKVGMKAPGFTLDKIGGGKMRLAEHEGKSVVLLDFFASWCGPCRMGMPMIDELAKEYKDKGVAFYAVNLQEGEKVAKKFIDNNSITNLEVVLDPDGKIGEAYEAFSIPRTVIVGKDGVVQAIHRGFSPNLKEDIKKDLDAILKGKTPAS